MAKWISGFGFWAPGFRREPCGSVGRKSGSSRSPDPWLAQDTQPPLPGNPQTHGIGGVRGVGVESTDCSLDTLLNHLQAMHAMQAISDDPVIRPSSWEL